MAGEFPLGDAVIRIKLEPVDIIAATNEARQQAEAAGSGISQSFQGIGAASKEASGAVQDSLNAINTAATVAGVRLTFLQRAFQVLATVANPATIAVGLVGASFIKATSDADKFDKAFERLQLGFKLGENEVSLLKAQILSLGPVLGDSSRLVEAYTVAVGKGFVPPDGGKAGIQFLKDIALFGRAVGQDPVRAMESVTDTLKAYSLEADQASKITRNLFQIGLLVGAENLPAVQTGLERIAPTARQVGIGFDEAAAALIQLSRSGQTGIRATFALRTALDTLATKSDEFRKKFGIDLRAAIGKDGLVGAFELLETAIKNDETAQKELGISFREFTTILSVLRSRGEDYKKTVEDLKNPTVDLASTTKKESRTIGESFGLIGKSLSNISTAAGETFVKPTRAAVGALADLAIAASQVAAPVIEPRAASESAVLADNALKIRDRIKEQVNFFRDGVKELTNQERAQRKIIALASERRRLELDIILGIKGATVAQAEANLRRARESFDIAAKEQVTAERTAEQIKQTRIEAAKSVAEAERAVRDAQLAEAQEVFNLRKALGQVTVADEIRFNEQIIRSVETTNAQKIASEQRVAQIRQSLADQQLSLGERLTRQAVEELKKEGRAFIDETSVQLKQFEILSRRRVGGLVTPEEFLRGIDVAKLAQEARKLDEAFGVGGATGAVRAFFESLEFGPQKLAAVSAKSLVGAGIPGVPAEVAGAPKFFPAPEEANRLVDQNVAIVQRGLSSMATELENFVTRVDQIAGRAGGPTSTDVIFGRALDILDRKLAERLQRELDRGAIVGAGLGG